MSDVVIKIENLYKEYRLGVISHRTLYHDLQSAWSKFRGKEDPNSLVIKNKRSTEDRFLALNNISVDIRQGDVLGVVGKNGAGKSTLLKVLSKITSPTQGEIKIKGRIASLLEVGTGFHNELTGRENIYLNGSILGMTTREIQSKIDEIIEFSGVSEHIDTPVKRYSSGMYVRLAFAVAAHLEPEILVVDEVLAVGDIEFQKKCLGKMNSIAHNEGRTVLFVSHNMAVLKQICNRAIYLRQGALVLDSTVEDVIKNYVQSDVSSRSQKIWKDEDTAPRIGEWLVLKSAKVSDERGHIRSQFDIKEGIILEIVYEVKEERLSYSTHFYLRDESGTTILVSMDNKYSKFVGLAQPKGVYTHRCKIPGNFLNEGVISVEALICTNPSSTYYVTQDDVINFEITDDMSPAGVRGDWEREWPKAMIRPELKWEILP